MKHLMSYLYIIILIFSISYLASAQAGTATDLITVDGISIAKQVTIPATAGNFKRIPHHTSLIDNSIHSHSGALDEFTAELLWQTGDTYGMCNDCAISPEGAYMGLGISLNNQRGELYHYASGTPIWAFNSGDGATRVAVSEDADIFVYGYQHYISVFEETSGTPSWTYDLGANAWVYWVAVKRDGSMLTVAWTVETQGYVTAFDPASATPLWQASTTFPPGFGWYGMRFSASGNRLSANGKYNVMVIDPADGNILWETAVDNTESPVPLSADGNLLAIGSNAAGTCRLYEWSGMADNYQLLWTYYFTGGSSRWCSEVEISADGSTVAAGSLIFLGGSLYDGTAAVFEADGGGIPLWVSSSFGDLVGEIAISDDGQTIAIGSWGHIDNSTPDLRLYEKYSSDPFYTLNHPGSINSIDISSEGTMVFAGGKHVHNRIYGNGGDAYCIEIDHGYDVEVTLTPANPPIQIPANGGAFDFNVEIANIGTSQIICDGWAMVTLPNGSQYGPVLGPVELTLNGGTSVERDRTQAVPATAPAGEYTYDAYAGIYPDILWNEDHFEFEKLAGGGDITLFDDWYYWGEDFENPALETNIDADYKLLSACPNPFNPATVIHYELPELAEVQLLVFDISGREVAKLVEGLQSAGSHEISFDGSGLASGLYYARLVSGEYVRTQKLLLLK